VPKVRVILLRTAGTNCDLELEHAFKIAGAETALVHINSLVRGERDLADYQILAIPGGFTYGDDIAAGTILANELMTRLKDSVRAFVEAGKLVIGICNGFQVLVKMGLLPEADFDSTHTAVTLTNNDSQKFEDRWVYLRCERSNSVFVNGQEGAVIYLPVAHAEGKFVAAGDAVLDGLEERGQVVFRYVDEAGGRADYPANPNGSMGAIAGISDTTGRILGMMPHPERFISPYHHPRWTREGLRKEGDGVAIFRNAVKYCS